MSRDLILPSRHRLIDEHQEERLNQPASFAWGVAAQLRGVYQLRGPDSKVEDADEGST